MGLCYAGRISEQARGPAMLEEEEGAVKLLRQALTQGLYEGER
jgi:hypothetical protein